MGVKERRARAKEGLRQEILEAARELFAENGYQDVTIRRIAEKIEYSPTTIYLYFEDKDDLLHQICEETFAKLYATLEKLTSDRSAGDPLIPLRNGLRGYVDFGLAHPNHYRVAFMMRVERDLKPDD